MGGLRRESPLRCLYALVERACGFQVCASKHSHLQLDVERRLEQTIPCFDIKPIEMKCLVVLTTLIAVSAGLPLQAWTEQPRYQEVNPHGSVVMSCIIANKKGECRWEKDGDPVGMYPTKYEWAGNPEDGDCSIKIMDATLEYDDGVWQCQVTPTNYLNRDSLISEGAQLVVRGKSKFWHINLRALSSL